MKDLLIFPYNGNGLEAYYCLGNQFRCIGFVDDTPEKQGMSKQGVPVYGREAFSRFPDAQVLAVPGSPASFRIRHEIIAQLNIPDSRFATVIHPSARVTNDCVIGYNSLIMAGVVLTSNCIIGNHVCLLPNTVIHHDSEIGDFSLIGSNVTVAGFSFVENNSYIGSGSSIINGIKVGAGTIVGMGSNVIRNVPANSKIAGNPARQL